jgi:galacturan 1,4-alpha-galacturonidase
MWSWREYRLSGQRDIPHQLSSEPCGERCEHRLEGRVVGKSALYLGPKMERVHMQMLTMFKFSEDLEYWRNNSYHIEFQNHAAGFVLTGDHIKIDGHGTGGINGNGQIWYFDERNETKGATVGATRPGRPMPFVLWNVSDVTVSNFHVVQPQLWAINMMNATNIVFDNIYVNATSPEAPHGVNWVQNTDGFSTQTWLRMMGMVAD